jgi:1-acyl-sn-glycerol-3-phosphate acyltransferase
VTGLENVPRGTAYVAAGNHISIYDPPLLLSLWPETLEAIGAVDVFDKPVHTGDTIRINEKDFKVVGIMARIGNPSDDKNIYMVLDDFKDLFNSGDRVDEMIVQVQKVESFCIVF